MTIRVVAAGVRRDRSIQVAYYTDGLHSTWRRPADYVDIARHVAGGRREGDDWGKQTRAARRPVS